MDRFGCDDYVFCHPLHESDNLRWNRGELRVVFASLHNLKGSYEENNVICRGCIHPGIEKSCERSYGQRQTALRYTEESLTMLRDCGTDSYAF